MPAPHIRRVLPQRRHRDEDGEDESSIAGDLDDFSLSEGSGISNGDDEADVEGSEVSAEEEEVRPVVVDSKIAGKPPVSQTTPASSAKNTVTLAGTPHEVARASTNGLLRADTTSPDGKQQHHVDLASDDTTNRASASAPQLSQSSETLAEQARREHLEYIRQKNSNPAFVPNRGGFFLHDDRSAAPPQAFGRPHPRGRGRAIQPSYGVGRGFGQTMNGPSDRPWAHDLHETVNKETESAPAKDAPTHFPIPTAKPAAIAPNRTFSVSTILGNVTIQVYLPGTNERKTSQSLTKKQHTLLPQHRPPLRRDKPVRISIPDEDPRYIFPSTERSFIFIPRAMRPNQQTYTRGRGRGSYHGSRRPSILGSAYTPSIAMSRRSSLGGAGSTGMNTPTDGNIPRGPMLPNFNRPIVRMPVAPLMVAGMSQPHMSLMPGFGVPMPIEHNNPGSAILHSPTVTLPIHQPRPQKTVSVAEIESPAIKGPQQQQEQPFHQQMPPGVSLVNGPMAQQGHPQANIAINTPLSHIPEGAVYAQPFQPYPTYAPGSYYGPSYGGGSIVYPSGADPYSMGIGGPVMPPQFTPGQSFVPAHQPNESGALGRPMAHESNGMVYYYDPSRYPTDGPHMQYTIPMGNSMVGVPPAGPYFYSSVPGGMYYAAGQ